MLQALSSRWVSFALALTVIIGMNCPGRGEDTAQAVYRPLELPEQSSVSFEDLTIHDQARNREIPVRVYRDASRRDAPLILFSHGLGGSREMGSYLGEHWAARGYVVVFLQHPGSDTSVWQGKRPAQIMAAMQQAANAENFLLRVKDVPAVIDQLERWNLDPKHALFHAIDIQRIGMSGHSFGALTTQAVSGQTSQRSNFNVTDPRIKAAIPMSPSSPSNGTPDQAFAKVQIPWMLMTGTEDVSPIGGQSAASRRVVFTALPPGDKYEVVLYKGQHSAFTDRPLPRDRGTRNPNHHRVILGASTAFWDAYLKNDSNAKIWLESDRPRSLLEPEDLWQRK